MTGSFPGKISDLLVTLSAQTTSCSAPLMFSDPRTFRPGRLQDYIPRDGRIIQEARKTNSNEQKQRTASRTLSRLMSFWWLPLRSEVINAMTSDLPLATVSSLNPEMNPNLQENVMHNLLAVKISCGLEEHKCGTYVSVSQENLHVEPRNGSCERRT